MSITSLELTPQEWQEIESIRAGLGTKFCQWCEDKCPYHLPIREQIVEGIKFYEGLRS